MLKVRPNTCAVFGQCMGAAMAMRAVGTIAQQRGGRKSPFSGHFVFHNATVGTWVREITDIVERGKGKILAWHELDGDHMREGESGGGRGPHNGTELTQRLPQQPWRTRTSLR